jgi:GT2 family glycosyltransferase
MSDIKHDSTCVYVPVFNGKETISECLDALAAQTLRPREIIVVDDGSNDGSGELIAKQNVTYIRQEENKGLAAARNLAVERSTSDIIAGVDADCIADRTWLEILVNELKSVAFHGVVGVGGRAIERGVTTSADRWRSIFMKQHWGEERCTPPYLFGSNTVFIRQALLDAGMYDPSLRTNYEDVDLCIRLKKQGLFCQYNPDAVVYHVKRDTVSSVLQSYWRWQKIPKARQGRFDSPDGLREQLHYNRAYASIDLLKAAETADPELVYITSLLFFSHSLLDIREFLERNACRSSAHGDPDEALRKLRALRAELIDILKNNARQISDVPTIGRDLSHTVFKSNMKAPAAAMSWDLFKPYVTELLTVASRMSSQVSEVCERAHVEFGRALWVHSA